MRPLKFQREKARYEVATQDEEYIDADPAAGKTHIRCVKYHHQNDGNGSKPVELNYAMHCGSPNE